MGYNTLIVVMTDAMHEIRDDKDFGEKVYYASLSPEVHSGKIKDICAGGHVNAATVIATYHADDYKLVCAGGNFAEVLTSRFGNKDPLMMVKQWLASQGYEVRRKPVKSR